MNEALQNLEIKVENEGTTPQGRLTATEWNILVAAVKAIDADDTKIDSAEIIRIVKEAGYVTSSDLARAYVTIYAPQTISARHDFTDGLKVGGLPIYKSQDDTLYLDCNLVVRGGITARGTNETITASIFEALPIDGNTIKRTADGRLYVDADALNISGGGGVADSVSWKNVTDKPSWIGATKPTYTPQEIGALPTTGGTVKGDIYSENYLTDGVAYIQKIRIENDNEINGYSAYNGGSATNNIHLNYISSGNVTLCNGGGNVAIGGTGAFEKLYVYGNVSATGNINAQNQFHLNGLEVMGWRSNNYYLFAGGENMTVHVGGSNVNINGNLLALGGITGRYTSDMRLKQNRRGFKASEVLMSLGAVQQFEYIPSEVAKNKIYEGTHIGLIYQNVIGTALNRMCYEREDGFGSLNYLEPSFISLLAGVGQEHEIRLTKYEREIQALRKKVEQLEKRVA